ncbi:MAG: VanZ family protein, partial [Chloroflexota bacterium]
MGGQRLDIAFQKTGHFLAYAILTLLVYRPLRHRKRAFLMAFLIASLYAASDEWHQTFVPGREGTVRDWGIDLAGSIVALIALAWLHRDPIPLNEKHVFKNKSTSRGCRSSPWFAPRPRRCFP